jgi:hypothetical protein
MLKQLVSLSIRFRITQCIVLNFGGALLLFLLFSIIEIWTNVSGGGLLYLYIYGKVAFSFVVFWSKVKERKTRVCGWKEKRECVFGLCVGRRLLLAERVRRERRGKFCCVGVFFFWTFRSLWNEMKKATSGVCVLGWGYAGSVF